MLNETSTILDLLNAKSKLPWKPYYIQDGNQIDEKPMESSLVAQWSLSCTVAFIIIVFVVENYLNQRQHRAYQVADFPKRVESVVGKLDWEASKKKNRDAKSEQNNLLPKLRMKFNESQSYGIDKIKFDMVSALYRTIESIAILLFGFLPYIWDTAKSIGSKGFSQFHIESEMGTALIFLLMVTIIGMITHLPLDYYSKFYIEKKYGFNKMTISLFISDKIKLLILNIVIGGPFAAMLLQIINIGGDLFYVYAWAFMLVFSLFMVTIIPAVIMPIFNKFEPLPDGSLKTRIFALAEKTEYPLTNLFLMDGSKRSSHSNAFMFGLGKNKRIVLFDTLLNHVSEDEIIAIMGHELGHWKLGHTLMGIVLTQVYIGVLFYTFSIFLHYNDLFEGFGFSTQTDSIPTIIALLLFMKTIWAPIEKCLSVVMVCVSRYNEFQADEYSYDLGNCIGLQSGLCKIFLENLGPLCPDKWYSIYHFSHPPLVERLERLTELNAKNK